MPDVCNTQSHNKRGARRWARGWQPACPNSLPNLGQMHAHCFGASITMEPCRLQPPYMVSLQSAAAEGWSCPTGIIESRCVPLHPRVCRLYIPAADLQTLEEVTAVPTGSILILLACLQLAAGAVADFKPSKKGTALWQAGQKRQGMGQLQRTLTRMQTVLEAEAHLGCNSAAS